MENVKYEVKNRIGYVTIDRPKALNALNQQVLRELGQKTWQNIFCETVYQQLVWESDR